MAEQRDALTELVQQHVGTHTGSQKMPIAAFCRRAVDPDTGYQPSNGLVGKIVRGESYKVTPQLIGALAAGLRIPRAVAAAAAHLQLIGYEDEELREGAPATVTRLLKSGPVGEADLRAAQRIAGEPASARE
jgi:hypothetical protein